ncbi:GNAT family N-acetyltransferase [Plantactinospora endophytica]|uniref:N-acetyltransferase domain-containing protein n=1 Tax=Plantactinospora endophytica TaxID=673535 RepID=A0ABQ4E1Z3_9ACTN|nr:GNAT family N-acetyltransferase [Plantactinospora endophytica]GIG88728.1 hypothetical protein Pen02_36640 [Plantactinospora endophytica]
MTAEIRLRTFNADQAGPVLEELVAIYVEVYDDSTDAFHGEQRYRIQLAGHMATPGWKLVTAGTDDEIIGYAYGFPLPPTTRWWRGLQTPLDSGFTEEDGRRTFAVSEIMVRTAWRRKGIGRSLHDTLLAGRPEPRATLLAEPDNFPAQAAYAAWGWDKVAVLRPRWDNAPLYEVLVKGVAPQL